MPTVVLAVLVELVEVAELAELEEHVVHCTVVLLQCILNQTNHPYHHPPQVVVLYFVHVELVELVEFEQTVFDTPCYRLCCQAQLDVLVELALAVVVIDIVQHTDLVEVLVLVFAFVVLVLLAAFVLLVVLVVLVVEYTLVVYNILVIFFVPLQLLFVELM